MYDLGDSRRVRHILKILIAHLLEMIAFPLSEFYCVAVACFSYAGARVRLCPPTKGLEDGSSGLLF
jgi:hypothetical protein